MFSIFRRPLAALAILLAAAIAMPAQAQFSEGYKFLEAIRKKEGDKVTEALNEPGTQIVNTKDYSTGQTGLHIVTARRDLTWVQFLIAKGANVNARDNRGVTPLVLATEMGFIEGADELIQSGARIDEANNTGETPLISAVHRKDLALVRLLIKAGANVDRPDNSGRSARDYATLEGKSSAVLGEIERSSKEAKGTAPKKTYGPSF
ncbi:MAG: ankyrin repeat domain-containing protein [Novosphingobium sp.]|uniref:ankyrin repeat domain-containing protein n=1 Tax=Novosphingobium sp. TaxID=1874826 RepID=UPI00273400EF|nr:ankyrin repeat domain-containing protein [Novosphingobium sp.]MDP3552100.1 ankyrin repeat domain-containing protein [Novosphingobium sp.]